MKNKYILITICSFVIYCNLNGQISHGGIPLTFRDDKSSMQKIPAIINHSEVKLIDNNQEKITAKELELEKGYNSLKLYGKGITMDIDFKKVASVQQLGDSAKLYLYQISSSSAYAIQLYFDEYKLPPGAKMFFYNKEKTMFLGSYTSDNHYNNNSFGTTFIKGSTAVIEYYEPNNVEYSSQIHINKMCHVFQDIYTNSGTTGSEWCEIDAKSSLGYGWERERRAVGIILAESNDIYKNDHPNLPNDYFGFGTGVLLNNVRQDGTSVRRSAAIGVRC